MSDTSLACEQTWLIDDLTIRGLSWGNPKFPTILALHGWLDNAASFSEVAPLLSDYHVVAVDLPGHGMSDNRSSNSSYQIWDDLPQLCTLIEIIAQSKVALMGHSRGAIIALLLASVLSEKVKAVIALDALIPQAIAESDVVEQLKRFISDRERMLQRRPTFLNNREDALRYRCRSGLSLTAVESLAKRSLVYDEKKGYYWRHDQRLKGASAVKFSDSQISGILESIEVPVLLATAMNGLIFDTGFMKIIEKNLKVMEWVEFKGNHHFHLEESAGLLSIKINQFLEKIFSA